MMVARPIDIISSLLDGCKRTGLFEVWIHRRAGDDGDDAGSTGMVSSFWMDEKVPVSPKFRFPTGGVGVRARRWRRCWSLLVCVCARARACFAASRDVVGVGHGAVCHEWGRRDCKLWTLGSGFSGDFLNFFWGVFWVSVTFPIPGSLSSPKI
jgi:hypothetical protein